jgi:zinc transporter, ZIP family
MASMKGLRLGLPLAIAIGIHNIPEGIAVALPVSVPLGACYPSREGGFLGVLG